MTCTASNAELMERASVGDVEAFAEVYDRLAPTMLALIRRVLGSPSDAHDVLHDVFIEAWRNVRGYDVERGSVVAWLAVRARSRALDRRARLAQQKSSYAVLPGAAASLPPSERELALQQALARLPPQVRETLELTYFEGLTATELSTRMHVPEGTVRSRISRGLSALKDMLEPTTE
jgi:RNA polymerase sigma-70 factor, ECF subfamily